MEDGILPMLFPQGVAAGSQGARSPCPSSILLWCNLEGRKDTWVHLAEEAHSPSTIFSSPFTSFKSFPPLFLSITFRFSCLDPCFCPSLQCQLFLWHPIFHQRPFQTCLFLLSAGVTTLCCLDIGGLTMSSSVNYEQGCEGQVQVGTEPCAVR